MTAHLTSQAFWLKIRIVCSERQKSFDFGTTFQSRQLRDHMSLGYLHAL